jgi:hypothetical protein
LLPRVTKGCGWRSFGRQGSSGDIGDDDYLRIRMNEWHQVVRQSMGSGGDQKQAAGSPDSAGIGNARQQYWPNSDGLLRRPGGISNGGRRGEIERGPRAICSYCWRCNRQGIKED